MGEGDHSGVSPDSSDLLGIQASLLRAVATDQPLGATLELVCRGAESALPGCTAAVLLLDAEQQRLRVAAGERVPRAVAQAFEQVQVPRTTVAAGRSRTVAADLSPDSDVWAALGVPPPAAGSIPFSTAWVTGLVSQSGETLGILHVLWPDPQVLRPADRSRLELLADLAVSVLLRYDRQQQVLRLVTNERDRIAGDIHDDPIQAMTVVSLRLQRLIGRLTEGEERSLATQTLEAVDGAIGRLRSMLFELHPSTLDDDGLVPTFEVYLEDRIHATADAVEWEVTGSETDRAPVQVEGLAFRLGREAITNSLRHAEPSRIVVDVARNELSVDLTITDDGVGFDPRNDTARVGHLGLTHSASLAASAGGTYRVESAVGDGTVVRISLPTVARP